jgi:hypothetical protein
VADAWRRLRSHFWPVYDGSEVRTGFVWNHDKSNSFSIVAQGFSGSLIIKPVWAASTTRRTRLNKYHNLDFIYLSIGSISKSLTFLIRLHLRRSSHWHANLRVKSKIPCLKVVYFQKPILEGEGILKTFSLKSEAIDQIHSSVVSKGPLLGIHMNQLLTKSGINVASDGKISSNRVRGIYRINAVSVTKAILK